jgi:hypothetical protein
MLFMIEHAKIFPFFADYEASAAPSFFARHNAMSMICQLACMTKISVSVCPHP